MSGSNPQSPDSCTDAAGTILSMLRQLPELPTYSPQRAHAHRAIGILDVYQERSLSKEVDLVTLGIRDASLAIKHLDPIFCIFQTTEEAAHPAWRGKIASANAVNAHLMNVADASRAQRLPLIALCTASPEDAATYQRSLDLCDAVLVTKSATARALRQSGSLLARTVHVVDSPATLSEFGRTARLEGAAITALENAFLGGRRRVQNESRGSSL